jgi:predicted DCC family thiol-disulfide oxidoreductase YuxK
LPSSRRWPSSEPSVVLFDGVCNLCSSVVRFIVARDPRARFRFAPIQSDFGASKLHTFGDAVSGPDTIVLIEDDRAYVKSAAALRIARRLTFPWPLLSLLWVLPRPVRDAAYDFVARRRYRWFGRTERCLLPTPELRERFLTVDTPKPAQIR